MKRQRDGLAAMAMQGMLAHSRRYRPRPGAPSNWHKALAQEAYEIADAMMDASLDRTSKSVAIESDFLERTK